MPPVKTGGRPRRRAPIIAAMGTDTATRDGGGGDEHEQHGGGGDGDGLVGGTWGARPVTPRANPMSVSQAMALPSTTPVVATISASHRNIARTWRRVVPVSRSRATSRRRSSTTMTRVLMAATAANPPSTPAMIRLAHSLSSSSSSTWAA